MEFHGEARLKGSKSQAKHISKKSSLASTEIVSVRIHNLASRRIETMNASKYASTTATQDLTGFDTLEMPHRTEDNARSYM